MLYVYETIFESLSPGRFYPFTICILPPSKLREYKISIFTHENIPRQLNTKEIWKIVGLRLIDFIDTSAYDEENLMNKLITNLQNWIYHVEPSRIVEVRSDDDQKIMVNGIIIVRESKTFLQIYERYLKSIIYQTLLFTKRNPHFRPDLLSQIEAFNTLSIESEV